MTGKTDLQNVKLLQRNATLSVIFSMIAIVAAIGKHFVEQQLWDKTLTASDGAKNSMLLISILLVAAQWLVYTRLYRTTLKKLPQVDDVATRLLVYRKASKTLFLTTLFSIILISAFVIMSGIRILLALALIQWMLLILNYPNMYRIKAEANLDDGTMRQLFGETYQVDEHSEQTPEEQSDSHE